MTMGLYGPAFFAGRSEFVQASAAATVPHLVDLVHPRSVLDVGCGQGEWLAAFKLVDVFGVDIAAPESRTCGWHDLTKPLDLGREFDLVLCVEVGEHLPAEAAETLVESCVLHSDNVVFGAAVPGQEGIGHINCQPHEYWHELFAENGYTMHDTIRPLLANNPYVSPWYRNNMFLYKAGL